MSEFRQVKGFEDVWRPAARPRRVHATSWLSEGASGAEARARLARVVRRAPEVMVKITGRTRDPAHLAAHFSYITRAGDLEARLQDGGTAVGRQEVRELADSWAVDLLDRRVRAGSPLGLALVLSMPAGTDPLKLEPAAAAFADRVFGGRHDYAFVLHTDTPRPHVHLTVRARGRDGERLNPKKPDLEAWRQVFAEELRQRGIEAEATPRRARGVVRKAERTSLRKMRERFEAGAGAMPQRLRSAYRDAAAAAFGPGDPPAWEAAIRGRQLRIRRFYLAQAKLLQVSDDPADRALGREVEAFVRDMPAAETRKEILARELLSANARLRREPLSVPDRGAEPSPKRAPTARG